MTRQEFLTAVRQDGAVFRADEISIDTGKEKICGKGTLHVKKSRFLLAVTLDGTTAIPSTPSGIISHKDFWRVKGVLENELPFGLESMPSGTGLRQTVAFFWKSLNFSSYVIDLIPCGLDAMTRDERKVWHLKAAAQFATVRGDKTLNALTPAALPTQDCRVDASYYAILRDYELIAFNGGTTTIVKNSFLGEKAPQRKLDTLHGEFRDWKFALIQDGPDVEVYFESKPDYSSLSEADDQRLFHAFLNAIAFTHGQHAWPFVIEYCRAGKTITDQIQFTRNVPQSAHAPFTKNMKRLGHIDDQWKFIDPLEKAFLFFCSESKLSKEITNLIYLFREASVPGVPKRITLLTLCSLFESLVTVVYDQQIASTFPPDTTIFERARNVAVKAVKQAAAKSNSPADFDRVVAILGSISPMRIDDKLEAIINHLNLQPRDRWDGISQLWRGFRNPIVHRLSDVDYSDESTKEQLLAESKIGGAINCVILKLMGYSGPVQASAYEQQYILI